VCYDYIDEAFMSNMIIKIEDIIIMTKKVPKKLEYCLSSDKNMNSLEELDS
jgi:hypothetical protein